VNSQPQDPRDEARNPERPDDGQRLLALRDFDFPVPEALIAQEPAARRDQARLLVRSSAGRLAHVHVSDLTTELPAGTLLILNDSRVFPSRLKGRLDTGGQVELFLLHPLPSSPNATGLSTTWEALGRPLKKLKPGTRITLADGLVARIAAKTEDGAGNGFVAVEVGTDAATFAGWLELNGFVPLPPYIKRPDAEPAGRSADRARYQTVYAKDHPSSAEPGSVAAPTAGLHFTKELLADLRQAGILIHTVSLNVGAGTFLPVKTPDLAAHRMHSERYRVGAETAKALVQARCEGRSVVAVGTTTLRSLEDLYRRAGGDPDRMVALADGWNTTDLFLYPRTPAERIKPWVIDGLFTNFHQPESTLFMLVCALLGIDAAKAMYREATELGYRLFSYGDACLLWL
jgi:S-adenosylmethionine:tRNA ribosyltransferase-isomerase